MNPRTQPPRFQPITDAQLKSLLDRYRCPMPLHALRTLFLGAIASPSLQVSPMAALSQAWGGELPEFESRENAQELFEALVMGLWNRLSAHQSARNPFRLPRVEVEKDRGALKVLADMRAQELAAFVDGLFGDEEELALPAKAQKALDALAECRAMFVGAGDLLADASKPAPAAELAELMRNLAKLTIIADEQINKVIQSCKRARAREIETLGVGRPARFDERARPGGHDAEAAGGDADDDFPEIIHSPLSRDLTRHGVSVRVEIYRGHDTGWILEVVDASNTSHVWDDPFPTDRGALDEAIRAVEEDPGAFR